METKVCIETALERVRTGIGAGENTGKSGITADRSGIRKFKRDR